jgi:hypothetical protein
MAESIIVVAVELLAYMAAFGLGAALLGPPLDYWMTFWQDRLDRHRVRCVVCGCRAARNADM